MAHFDNNLLLSECPWGFRKSCSATSLLLIIADSMRRTVSDKYIWALLSLDLSKALDRVSRVHFIYTLVRDFGFSKSLAVKCS